MNGQDKLNNTSVISEKNLFHLKRFRHMCSVLPDGNAKNAERALNHCLAEPCNPYLVGPYLCIAVELKHMELVRGLLKRTTDRSPLGPLRQAMRLVVTQYEWNRQSNSCTSSTISNDCDYTIALMLYENGAATHGALGPENSWNALMSVQQQLCATKLARSAAIAMYRILYKRRRLQRDIARDIAKLIWNTRNDSSLWPGNVALVKNTKI